MMYTFYVIDKTTRQLAFKYDAEAPIEWNEYPFALYDHEPHPHENAEPPPPPPPAPLHMRLTKLEFLRRFSQAERIAMRNAAAQSPEMHDYMAMLELAEEIFLDDADTVAGVTLLESVGIIAPGRATEVLSG